MGRAALSLRRPNCLDRSYRGLLRIRYLVGIPFRHNIALDDCTLFRKDFKSLRYLLTTHNIFSDNKSELAIRRRPRGFFALALRDFDTPHEMRPPAP